MTAKEEIHRLSDGLREDELETARRFLKDLRAAADDTLTAEELAEIEEGRKAIRRGEYVTLEEYERKRGLRTSRSGSRILPSKRSTV